jgi:hypothetical protein
MRGMPCSERHAKTEVDFADTEGVLLYSPQQAQIHFTELLGVIKMVKS